MSENTWQCLILSKIDYNDIVSDPIPDYLVKRLQRVQLAAASFVSGRYATKQDLLNLAWLPVVERKEQHLLSNAFKALYFEDWPSYLRLNTRNATRTLESGTFQDSTASVYNALPHHIRNSTEFSHSKSQLTNHLKTKARTRLYS